MSVECNYFNSLPDDAALLIFSNLGMKDLVSCCQVGHRWNSLASDDRVWEGIVKEIFGTLPQVSNFKNHIKENYITIKSDDELFERIQLFLSKISLGQDGYFTCFFGTVKFRNREFNRFFKIQVANLKDDVKIIDETKTEKTSIRETCKGGYKSPPTHLRLAYKISDEVLPDTSLCKNRFEVIGTCGTPYHLFPYLSIREKKILQKPGPVLAQLSYPPEFIEDGFVKKVTQLVLEKCDALVTQAHPPASLSKTITKKFSAVRDFFNKT